MEQRRFTRVPYMINATLTRGATTLTGEVSNLSLKGMMVKTTDRLAVDEPVEVIISMAGDCPDYTIALSGVVVRSDENGTGIRFDRMDVDSFIHLRRIVEYNSEDPQRVMGEFVEFVDEKVKEP